MKKQIKSILTLWIPALVFLSACKKDNEPKEVALYNNYCASCHIAPSIQELPKHIWETSVLPDMASRMDIEELYQDPAQLPPGFRPKIALSDWITLKNYIVSLAPDSLPSNPLPEHTTLAGFKTHLLNIDQEDGAFFTFMQYSESEGKLRLGDIYGALTSYDFASKKAQKVYQGFTPITWYSKGSTLEYISEVGILDPSEQEKGSLITRSGRDTTTFQSSLHRPVHHLAVDLNKNGVEEVVVSEFGNETGRLSLLIGKETGEIEKRVLLNQPGCIRTIASDMDRDGKLDLVTLTSQGNESITLLYQQENLRFTANKVIEFSPVFGSSWFELVDYNQDGHEDIITVHGDNADKSYVHKPYHGMRIHINDGNNNFVESYFYPLNGATRCIARDFDQDGDVDVALLSTFPNYEDAPQLSFVYLENQDAEGFKFETRVLDNPNIGRWFLLDAGDVDNDGDEDIILSSFTYTFTPVPKRLSALWAESDIDLLLLENTLH